MDYRKINSHIILLSIVLLVGVAISMIGRRVVLENGFDIGTANLTFLIIFGICVVFYLIILATLAHSIIPWVMKKLPRKNESTTILIENIDNSPSEKEEMLRLQSIDEIRRNADKLFIDKEIAKINLFIEYSHLTMAPYITNDELLRLDEYIKYFARKESLPDNLIPIKPRELKNPDMFHFGWNMSHYFEHDKQEVVPWLKTVFSELNKLSPSTIKGKLYDYQTRKHTIPNIDDIPKYMSENRS